MDSLQSEVWTSLFREHSEIFSPLWPWVHQMHRAAWWDVAVLKANVIACLCHYRLDEEALVQELQPFLQTQMARFVQQLIDITVDKCATKSFSISWSLWTPLLPASRTAAIRWTSRAPRTPGTWRTAL